MLYRAVDPSLASDINADRTTTHFIGSSLEVSVKRRPGRHPAATYRSGRGGIGTKKKDSLSKDKHTSTTGRNFGSSSLALRPLLSASDATKVKGLRIPLYARNLQKPVYVHDSKRKIVME